MTPGSGGLSTHPEPGAISDPARIAARMERSSRPTQAPATTAGGSTGSAVRSVAYRLITRPYGSTKL